MLISRVKTNECKITIIPGDNLFSGDLIDWISEKWLVIETYIDEYDITYGKAFLCNHLFRFQTKTPEVIEKLGVLDNGTYISKNENRLPLPDGQYTAYLPLDDETEKIYIDKRFAISTLYDKNYDCILSVGKVSWIDKKTDNLGRGSHLLKMRLENDVFNKGADSTKELICDYISDKEPTPILPNLLHCNIEGKETLRIGTSRIYTSYVTDGNGEIVSPPAGFEWTYSTAFGNISIVIDGDACNVQVPLSSALIGSEIVLSVVDTDYNCAPTTKRIRVTNFG
jgi:hypothetical protein